MSGRDGPRAPQVCCHCKSIKKGCDKRLPSCSQCVKRRAVCRYEEPAESWEKKRSHETLTRASVSHTTCAQLDPSIQLSLLLVTALSNARTPYRLDSRTSTTTGSTSPSYAQVSQIIHADGGYMYDVVSKYFKGVHRWLPILSHARFCHRLAHFQSYPTADFSILLLSMQLITQHPSQGPDTNEEREILYLATKTMFAQVQAFVPWSLYLVQAGIILARCEHAHGMIEAAYVTIGTCARMASAMGFHNRSCSTEPQGSPAWLDEEEVLCTWWGLAICDRIISVYPQMSGRPLATRRIRESDYLPLESEDLDDKYATFSEPKSRYPVSATLMTDIGSYGREAQAIYLLDKANKSIEDGLDPFEMYPFSREIQKVLLLIMEQMGGRWGEYCGATQLLVTQLYILHHNAALHPSLGALHGVKETIDSALGAITRIVVDTSVAFNRDCETLNIEVLCPIFSHIVRGAQQHIIMADDLNDPQWKQDFESLCRTLSYYERRWPLAALELHTLNETIEALRPPRAH